MANIQEFERRILKIEGVEGYLLIRNDGRVLAQNPEAPPKMAPMVAFGGLSGDAIKAVLGTTRFRFLLLTRQNGEKLCVFPLESYFLAVISHPDAYTPEVVSKIENLLNAVVKKT